MKPIERAAIRYTRARAQLAMREYADQAQRAEANSDRHAADKLWDRAHHQWQTVILCDHCLHQFDLASVPQAPTCSTAKIFTVKMGDAQQATGT